MSAYFSKDDITISIILKGCPIVHCNTKFPYRFGSSFQSQ